MKEFLKIPALALVIGWTLGYVYGFLLNLWALIPASIYVLYLVWLVLDL